MAEKKNYSFKIAADGGDHRHRIISPSFSRLSPSAFSPAIQHIASTAATMALRVCPKSCAATWKKNLKKNRERGGLQRGIWYNGLAQTCYGRLPADERKRKKNGKAI